MTTSQCLRLRHHETCLGDSPEGRHQHEFTGQSGTYLVWWDVDGTYHDELLPWQLRV